MERMNYECTWQDGGIFKFCQIKKADIQESNFIPMTFLISHRYYVVVKIRTALDFGGGGLTEKGSLG